MKDKLARALAIVALIFMAVFVGSLIATLTDRTLLGGGIGYLALASGVFTFMIFIALKADGRGYSVTKMNNEIEMEKLEKAVAEKLKCEQEQQQAADDDTTAQEQDDGAKVDP